MTVEFIHTKVDFQRHLNGCEQRLNNLIKTVQKIEKITENSLCNNNQLNFNQLDAIDSEIKFIHSAIFQLNQCSHITIGKRRLNSLKNNLNKIQIKFQDIQQHAHDKLGYEYKENNDTEQLNDEEQEQSVKLIQRNINSENFELDRIQNHSTIVGFLEKDIIDLHETFHDLNRIVIGQGEIINNIEQALTSTDIIISEATEQVAKAVELKTSSKRKKWILFLVLICVLFIVLLIIFISIKLAVPFH